MLPCHFILGKCICYSMFQSHLDWIRGSWGKIESSVTSGGCICKQTTQRDHVRFLYVVFLFSFLFFSHGGRDWKHLCWQVRDSQSISAPYIYFSVMQESSMDELEYYTVDIWQIWHGKSSVYTFKLHIAFTSLKCFQWRVSTNQRGGCFGQMGVRSCQHCMDGK